MLGPPTSTLSSAWNAATKAFPACVPSAAALPVKICILPVRRSNPAYAFSASINSASTLLYEALVATSSRPLAR